MTEYVKFHGDEIIKDRNGKVLRAITRGQQALLEAIDDNDIIFVNGPAGTGKSSIATWYGIAGIDDGIYDNLVISRPIVGAGEELGFLPGSFEEKVAPYMQPLYDAIELVKGKRITPEMASKFEASQPPVLSNYRKKKVGKGDMPAPKPRQKISPNEEFYKKVQVAPLAYLRGTTKAKSFIILDECFTGDTSIGYRIHGKNKVSRIDSIYRKVKRGDVVNVMSYNESLGVFEEKQVTDVFKKSTTNLIQINLRGRSNPIKCTSTHPFATTNTTGDLEWKLARDLTPDSKLVRYNETRNSSWHFPVSSYDILTGMLLGDATLSRNKSTIDNYRVQWIHGLKQSEYNEFKINMLSGSPRKSLKSGYTGNPLVGGSTTTLTLDPEFIDAMYITDVKTGIRTKHISDSIAKYFSDRSLALWYMDDGSYNTIHNNITFHTESFDDESIDVLCRVLRDRYGICPNVYAVNENKYKIISISVGDTKILVDVLGKYIHPELVYKIPESKRVSFDESIYTIPKQPAFSSCNIVDSIECVDGEFDVYNLEVADNNNYLVDGILVHNCQNVTKTQMKLMLTRIGHGSKLILCGDQNQSDLERSSDSGFRHAQQILQGVKGIGFVTLGVDDIVRHRLIKDIIMRYEYQGRNNNSDKSRVIDNREFLDEDYDYSDDDLDDEDYDPADDDDYVGPAEEYPEQDAAVNENYDR